MVAITAVVAMERAAGENLTKASMFYFVRYEEIIVAAKAKFLKIIF
jgi:hypothetical protein